MTSTQLEAYWTKTEMLLNDLVWTSETFINQNISLTDLNIKKLTISTWPTEQFLKCRNLKHSFMHLKWCPMQAWMGYYRLLYVQDPLQSFSKTNRILHRPLAQVSDLKYWGLHWTVLIVGVLVTAGSIRYFVCSPTHVLPNASLRTIRRTRCTC